MVRNETCLKDTLGRLFSKLKSFSYTFSPFEYNDYSANNEARRPPISIFLTDLSIGYVPQTL